MIRLASYRRLPLIRQRAFLGATRLLGAEIDDVGKVCLRRPDLFGKPMLALAHELLRGPSNWTVGERELLAAVVSEANSCSFCVGTHSAIADQALRSATFSGWQAGSAGPAVTAAAHFIRKLTLTPDEVSGADVAAARDAGVSDLALTEAIYIAFFFNLINRMADALEFTHRSERDRLRGASVLRRLGYRLPGFLVGSRQSSP